MNGERRPATTIGELDVHVGYALEALRQLAESVKNMATKQDIEQITGRMELFATKKELQDAESRWKAGTIGSSFDRMLTIITKVGAAVVVVVAASGGFVAVVHYADKLNVVTKAVP